MGVVVGAPEILACGKQKMVVLPEIELSASRKAHAVDLVRSLSAAVKGFHSQG